MQPQHTVVETELNQRLMHYTYWGNLRQVSVGKRGNSSRVDSLQERCFSGPREDQGIPRLIIAIQVFEKLNSRFWIQVSENNTKKT